MLHLSCQIIISLDGIHERKEKEKYKELVLISYNLDILLLANKRPLNTSLFVVEYEQDMLSMHEKSKFENTILLELQQTCILVGSSCYVFILLLEIWTLKNQVVLVLQVIKIHQL